MSPASPSVTPGTAGPAAVLPPAAAPTLETDRLVLRAHAPADHASCAAMWADPEVTRHIGGRPFTAEETWQRMLRYAGLWSLLGYGYWAITDRASGTYLGDVGVADFRRAMSPPLDVPEAGWALVTAAHGRGLATEALRAVLAWCDTVLAAPRTACLIDPGHAASVRVAEKCGYRLVREAAYGGGPVLVYERARASR